MSLHERLDVSKQIATEPKVDRRGNWGFTSEHAPHDHNTQSVTLVADEQFKDADDWTQAVKDMGGIVADGYRVRLVEMRHQTHGWTRSKSGKDAVTKPTWWYRFAVEPLKHDADVSDLIASIAKRKPAKTPLALGDAGVFNWIGGDLQLGKSDGDGTNGIVDAFIRSIDTAVLDYKRLRKDRKLSTVHLAFLGDCGEGNQSQNGRNMWRTELTITEQYRLFRRLMLYAVDAFAPLAAYVEMDVVNGNHDEAQRFQATREDDGHATESAIALADALDLNPAAYDHVKVFVPGKDEATITRHVGDSVMTMTHGNKWSRGKAMDWWAGQSLNWQAPGASQFLLHGHEHTGHFTTKRERTVICCPSFESESTWWRHKTGDVGKRGAIVFTSAAGEFKDFQII